MKFIPLSQGKEAIVDDDMYGYLMQWKWCFDGRYAVRNSNRKDTATKKRKKIYMHSVVMPAPTGLMTDHIESEKKLDNRRENLRVCTRKQNMYNSAKQTRNTSGFKGVSLQRKKYIARITANSKRFYIGSFIDPESAARAYDKKARELHGDFVVTNF